MKTRGADGRFVATGEPIIKNNGYRYFWSPDHPLANRDGYVAEHRAVVFAAGIDVPNGSIVHHRNGDRLDNSTENLEVLSRGEHQRLHQAQGDHRGPPRREIDIARVTELRQQGQTWKAIAADLGVGVMTVWKRAQETLR